MADSNEIIFIVIAGASTTAAAVYYVRNNRHKKRIDALNSKIQKLNDDVRHLEIENASAKLNPHLLKNTLNTIHYFSWQTTNALEKLSEMLKYILNNSSKKYVQLNEELDFLDSFYQVHKLKLSPQTKVNFNVATADANNKLRIAPLLTINFIENAFIHGDYTLPDSFLELNISINNNELIYEVKNTFTKQDKPTGFGNENFRKRLDLLHKGNYTLSLVPTETTYTAKLNLKLNEN